MNKQLRCFGVAALEILAIFGICFFYQILRKVELYVCDAEQYMSLAKIFWNEDGFSLANYPLALRGVSFPLLIAVFHFFCIHLNLDSIWAWRMFSSLIMAVFIYIFPYLITQKPSAKISGLRKKRGILLALIFFFWSGLLIYPLSDFASAFFLVAGMTLMLGQHSKGPWNGLRCFFAAMCIYTAYNTRTIYLFPAAVFFIGWLCISKEPPKTKAVQVLLFFGGIFAAGLPQIMVNYHWRGVLSPMVMTEYGGSPNGLFSWQMGMGLKYAEYETYTGDFYIFPVPAMVFPDMAGTMLLNEVGLTESTISIKDIILLFFRYPLDMIGVYMRHFINMLNPLWGEVYIKDLYGPKLHLTLINYFMMVTGFTYARTVKLPKSVWELFRSEIWKKKFLVYVTMLVPCLLILPGAVELRFFFPMYVLFYGFLLFEMGWDGIKQAGRVWKAHPLYCGFVCIMVFAAFLAVWGNTYAGLQFSPRWLNLE